MVHFLSVQSFNRLYKDHMEKAISFIHFKYIVNHHMFNSE